MSVFNLNPLPVKLSILVRQGWTWQGLALYQKTSALDFKSPMHGPIRLIPPVSLQNHVNDYFDGIITKKELFLRLGI